MRIEIQSSEVREFTEQEKYQVKSEKERERASKSIINVLQQQELDFRDIITSPHGNYLISCSEQHQGELPKIFIWNISEILEGAREPLAILEGKLKSSSLVKITNWFLCVDSIIIELQGKEWWIIVAGNIIGELFVWYGKINNTSKEWAFNDYNLIIFSEKENNFRFYPKAIMDLKLQKNHQKNSFNIYFALNNIHTVGRSHTKDNTLNELAINLNSETDINKKGLKVLGTLDEWITKIDLHKEKNFLVIGTRNGKVLKWNLSKPSPTPILIGEHEDYVSCVKIYTNGTKIISSSLDTTIRIWNDEDNNEPDLDNELLGHNKSVICLDIQRDDRYLISSSNDGIIKMWDLKEGIWIRNVEVENLLKVYKKQPFSTLTSKKLLNQVKISSDNRIVFVTLENMILVLKNFGIVYQFEEQLKFIRNFDKELYSKIYGENLLQIAEKKPENLDSLKMLYDIVKKRLKKANKIRSSGKLQLKGQDLGTLFIPSFVKFEENKKFQKEYLLGVKESYESYWNCIRNLFFKLPDQPWQFKLYITTDDDENITNAKFVEITNPELKDAAYLIMKDRNQTLIRFLMVLDNVPTSFVPLIQNITLNVEDDRGDNEVLIFSDFTYSTNFVKILSNARDSVEKFRHLKEPESFFYAFCTFQLEAGYSTEKYANLFIRDIKVEFTEDLNPTVKTLKTNEEEFFEAFKRNFQFPLIPKTQIQIGKGIASTVGKIIDDYFAKIIVVEFLLSLWGYIQAAVQELFPNLEILAVLSNIVSISTISLIILIFLMMIIKKK